MNKKRKIQNEIDAAIVAAVESYRRAHQNLKTVTAPSPRWEIACNMMMDRAAGALDVLWELSPESKAWTETGWCDSAS